MMTILPFLAPIAAGLWGGHKQEQAHKAARNTMESAIDRGAAYTAPYRDRGDRIGDTLEEQLKRLLDPQSLENEWASSYETSPYAEFMMDRAETQGKDLASSLGLLGSTTAEEGINVQKLGILGKDRQQYMNDLMQKYMNGINLGQGIYGTGANAASGLSSQWGQVGPQLGTSAYSRNAQGGNTLANIIDLLGSQQRESLGFGDDIYQVGRSPNNSGRGIGGGLY